LEILREYAAHDNRIRIIALDNNGGVSVARNAGIDAACGEYLGFVDSDDYVDTDFYEKLYKLAKQNQSDIAKGNLTRINIDGKKTVDDTLSKKIDKYGKYYFTHQWWCGLYHADIINKNNIRFRTDLSVGEDVLFLTECVLRANAVSVCFDTFYYYVRRDISADSDFYSLKQLSDVISAKRHICQLYNTSDISDDEYVEHYFSCWVHMFSLFDRNTRIEAKREIANCLISLYEQSKNKKQIIGRMLKHQPQFVKYLQSGDVDGLVNAVSHSASENVIALAKHKNGWGQTKLSLFGFAPFCAYQHGDNYFLIKIFGIRFFKFEYDKSNVRLNILYIPIITGVRK